MRAMFSHGLLYPPRPIPSIFDGHLVLPPGAAPPVGFPPGAQAAGGTLSPLFAPPLADRCDSRSQLRRRAAVADDHQGRLPPSAAGDAFTDPTARSQYTRHIPTFRK